jgi:hypothetical protein
MAIVVFQAEPDDVAAFVEYGKESNERFCMAIGLLQMCQAARLGLPECLVYIEAGKSLLQVQRELRLEGFVH